MGIQTQSALVSSLFLLSIAASISFQRRSVTGRWSFVGMVGALAAYNLCFFLHGVTGGARGWMQALLVAATVAAAFAVRFYARFLEERLALLRTLTSVAALAVFIMSWTPAAEWGPFGPIVASWTLAVFGFCGYRLFTRRRRAATEVDRARLGYLVVGHALTLAFSGLDLLPLVDVSFPSLGHLVATFYMYFWMQTIQRSRLLDLEELLGRGLALLILALPIAVLYSALVVWVGDQTGLFFFNTLVASVVVIFVFEPLKDGIEAWIGRLLYRETFEFERLLSGLRDDLKSLIDPEQSIRVALARLEGSRRVTHGSVHLLDADARTFSARGDFGPPPTRRLDVVRERPFLEALRKERLLAAETLDREYRDLSPDHRSGPAGRHIEAVRSTLQALESGLSFALLAQGRLLGFLNLKDDRLREPFSSHELRLIEGVAAQLALTVENSEHFARLQERDRLSVLGEMSAGLAHEIRNPLGSIKGAVQLLGPEGLDAEQREFVQIILEEVDRLDGVVGQFLDYARPHRGAPDTISLGPVLERIARLVRTQPHPAPIEVRVHVAPDLPRVRADASQLEQVFINLARNACEAMESGGVLTVSAEPLTDEGAHGRVAVTFADTGAGMPDDVQRLVFVPFFTTKGRGTGLGLAISQRIVQSVGGSITIRSQVGAGTHIVVKLRRADEPESGTGEFSRAVIG